MKTRAQVILHTTDNLSANYVTNSWCFITAGIPGLSDYPDYTTAFKDFYDDLSGFLSLPIAQNAHEVKYYDLEQTTPPNYPVATGTFNLASAPTSPGLPSEVALCLSFQGQKVPGFPQNRRRGRVYIGPLAQTQNTAGRPGVSLISGINAAAVALCTSLKAASVPADLAVWSQVDGDAVVVEDGWVDDAWDTQRRRGVQRTSRTTWTAP
jgi:hypothetical protein